MAHRIPHHWLLEARRRCQKLRSRAENLEHASSSSIVVGLYGVTLAYALTQELLPWLVAVAPLPLAGGLALRARRLRKRLEAHERRIGRLFQGFDPPQPAAGVHRLRRLRLVTWRRAGRGRGAARADRGSAERSPDLRRTPDLHADGRSR